jgi:hypothetical protein
MTSCKSSIGLRQEAGHAASVLDTATIFHSRVYVDACRTNGADSVFDVLGLQPAGKISRQRRNRLDDSSADGPVVRQPGPPEAIMGA